MLSPCVFDYRDKIRLSLRNFDSPAPYSFTVSYDSASDFQFLELVKSENSACVTGAGREGK